MHHIKPLPLWSRRRWLQGLASTGLATLAGCRQAAVTPTPENTNSTTDLEFTGHTLRLFVYSGFVEEVFRQVVVPRLESVTGAIILLQPGWWDALPKIRAAPQQPPYDLIITDATQGYSGIRAGLFQKINLERIPNRLQMAPAALENWVYKEGYGITYPDAVMTLVSHAQFTDFEPAQWSDLLRPEVHGKLGLYNSFYMSLFTFACMMVSATGQAGTAKATLERDLAGVLQFAREQRAAVGYWWATTTEMLQHLQHRACPIGNLNSPEVLLALQEKVPLRAVVPAADRAFLQMMWLVPAGSKEAELAAVAINEIFSEPVQTALAQHGTATALPTVANLMAQQNPLWAQFYPHTEADFINIPYYPYDTYLAHWQEIQAVWERQILRAG